MRKSGILGMAALLTVALAGCGHNGGSGDGTQTGRGRDAQPPARRREDPADRRDSQRALRTNTGSPSTPAALKAQQELAEQGTNINLIWKGTESEGDRNGQVNIVERLRHLACQRHRPRAARQAGPGDARPDAASRKIPVVIIDSSLNGTDWVSFDATDNEKGGELAGAQLASCSAAKETSSCCPMRRVPPAPRSARRASDTAISKYPGITILSDNQYGGPTTDTAQKASQNLLTRYGTQINGVFASNETNTRGMRLALKEAGLLRKVKFVGFDAAPDLVQALKADELQGLVVQNPFKMGDIGVTTVVGAVQGKAVPKTIDTGVALVTKDNIGEPEDAGISQSADRPVSEVERQEGRPMIEVSLS